MLRMDYEIIFLKDNKITRLYLLDSVEIEKSVDKLVDTATITLPASVMNKAQDIEQHVQVGDPVSIALGYNGDLKKEFEGYVQAISTDEGSIKLICEDELYQFRKDVQNIELVKTNVEKIVHYLFAELQKQDPKFQPKVNCTANIDYDKFVIHNTTAYEVLKKIQEELKANIYCQNGVLNIHPPYIEKTGEVVYDFSRNIESSSLVYKRKEDRKVQITIEKQGKNAKTEKFTTGTTGGETITRKVGNVSSNSLKAIAEDELRKHSYDGYEGSLTGWLIPYCEPTYSAEIVDADYPYKQGNYYVVSTKLSFGSSGGKREATLGLKLSSNG